MLERDDRLSAAREAVRQARKRHLGIFDARDPPMVLPFELRYPARRGTPDRYILHLDEDEPRLRPPTRYFEIDNLEDRLFVEAHFVPLWEKKRYRVMP